jgi:hypothetical protein
MAVNGRPGDRVFAGSSPPWYGLSGRGRGGVMPRCDDRRRRALPADLAGVITVALSAMRPVSQCNEDHA